MARVDHPHPFNIFGPDEYSHSLPEYKHLLPFDYQPRRINNADWLDPFMGTKPAPERDQFNRMVDSYSSLFKQDGESRTSQK